MQSSQGEQPVLQEKNKGELGGNAQIEVSLRATVLSNRCKQRRPEQHRISVNVSQFSHRYLI